MTDTRDESPADRARIHGLVEAAFASRVEADLVDQLREEGVVISSLVAVCDGEIVGHALFSQVWIDGEVPATLASLAPLAVRPDWQRGGIGAALVTKGIDACRSAGYAGIIVVGEPHYYARFGFSPDLVAHLASPYAGDAFMGLELMPGAIARLRGTVRYPRAFSTL